MGGVCGVVACVWTRQRDGKTSGAKDGEAAEGFTEERGGEESSLRPKDAPRLLGDREKEYKNERKEKKKRKEKKG